MFDFQNKHLLKLLDDARLLGMLTNTSQLLLCHSFKSVKIVMIPENKDTKSTDLPIYMATNNILGVCCFTVLYSYLSLTHGHWFWFADLCNCRWHEQSNVQTHVGFIGSFSLIVWLASTWGESVRQSVHDDLIEPEMEEQCLPLICL